MGRNGEATGGSVPAMVEGLERKALKATIPQAAMTAATSHPRAWLRGVRRLSTGCLGFDGVLPISPINQNLRRP
jgi:hypothetical protein